MQAWSRPYIRSFDFIYVQVDLIYLTLDLIYQILTIYLKTDFCPIWRVILESRNMLKLFLNVSDFEPQNSYTFFSYKKKCNARLSFHYERLMKSTTS